VNRKIFLAKLVSFPSQLQVFLMAGAINAPLAAVASNLAPNSREEPVAQVHITKKRRNNN